MYNSVLFLMDKLKNIISGRGIGTARLQVQPGSFKAAASSGARRVEVGPGNSTFYSSEISRPTNFRPWAAVSAVQDPNSANVERRNTMYEKPEYTEPRDTLHTEDKEPDYDYPWGEDAASSSQDPNLTNAGAGCRDTMYDDPWDSKFLDRLHQLADNKDKQNLTEQTGQSQSSSLGEGEQTEAKTASNTEYVQPDTEEAVPDEDYDRLIQDVKASSQKQEAQEGWLHTEPQKDKEMPQLA